MIDCAEDRQKFSSLMDSIGVKQPAWKELTRFNDFFNIILSFLKLV